MLAATTPIASNRRQRLLSSLLERSGLKAPPDRIPSRPANLDFVPLSSGQRGLWFLDRVAPGNPVYNVPTCFRIRGPLDVLALQSSLHEIVQRHEVLRTTFGQRNGEPMQLIADRVHVPMPVIDLRDQADRDLKRHAAEDARRPFELAKGPLIRVTLFRLGDEDHAVLITMHHIVCDGWSIGVLFQELTALYASAVQRTPAHIAELPVQYADYSLWQRERLDSGKLAPQIEYWRQHLQTAPRVVEFPTDRVRRQQASFRGAILQTAVTAPVSEALLELAQSESTSLFVLLLAAYAAFVHRYTGQDDTIIGCPLSNRNRSELEPLIGFFPNTLPMRIQTSTDPSFVSLVRDLRELTAKAFSNADAPFETITKATAGPRSPHRSLFQVAFMFQEHRPAMMTFGDIEIVPVDLDLQTAKCDLTLACASGAGGLTLAFEYSTDLFDRDTIQRMSCHFRTMLEGIASNPEARVSELPLMTAEEERQVLVDFGRTGTTKLDTRGLHELFEEHAGLTPDAPALVFGSKHTTYAELNLKANRIAHQLKDFGAGPGALIAVALNRTPNLIAAILGVLKSGAAYLPLSLDHPPDRIAFCIEDAKPMMLITSAQDRRGLPMVAQQLDWLDVSWVESTRAAEANLSPRSQSSDVAYVIYTSGSTGKPKGAIVEHQGLTNLATAQQQMFDLGPGCRVLQFAPHTFDASVWEIAMALGSGACLCLGEGAAFVPEELARALQEQQVTVVTLPPSILRTLTPANFPELRTIISAGESCPETLAREWSPNRSFFNAYGPTEATVCTTIARRQSSLPKVTIGRPITNMQTYIVDAQMRPVPVGVVGELHIGGLGVARGYLNRPELTRARFVANPFEPCGGRLYKSGDLARFLANGEIEFLGRIDEQLKIRGHRIEPGEIEARVESHPAVRECAVVMRECAGEEARLVAYFVPCGSEPDRDCLRTFVGEALPQYMVPSTFVPLRELPINTSGKVDRRALAQMEIPCQPSHTEARDELEITIKRIWEKVLKIPHVSIRDNFFELGGNSLMAVNLLARIAAETGFEIPVTALFGAGTVEQIARLVRERQSQGSPGQALVKLQPFGSKLPLVLIPPAGGGLISYSEMARVLSPDQPVFGIEELRDQKPADSVELLAARHIKTLYALGVEPPFHLGGWSFGGAVAFEMARQLSVQGCPVDLVVLLDSYATQDSKEPEELEILLEIARVQARVRGIELNLDPSRLRHLNPQRRAMLIAIQMATDRAFRPEAIANELHASVRHFRANMRAARRYVGGYYGGRVALMRTFGSGDHGWARLCADLGIYDIPGEHSTFLTQPHVTSLAKVLRGVLK